MIGIGQQFANMEGKLILASILRTFRIKCAPSQRDTKFTFILGGVTMKTAPEFKISLEAR